MIIVIIIINTGNVPCIVGDGFMFNEGAAALQWIADQGNYCYY